MVSCPYFFQIAQGQNDSKQSIPWLGINGIAVNNEVANLMNVTEPVGFLITKITPNSPASNSILVGGNSSFLVGNSMRMLGGDIIVKMDNIPISNKTDYDKELLSKNVDENVTLSVLRDNQIKDIELTIGSKPDHYFRDPSAYTNPEDVNFTGFEYMASGINIQKPTEWDVEIQPDVKEIPLDNSKIIFRSQPENRSDGTREYLRVFLLPHDTYPDLDAAIEVNSPYKNTQWSDTRSLEIGNNTAKLIYYTYDIPYHGKISNMKLAVESKNGYYIFTYSAQSEKFWKYAPTIIKMVNSFEPISFNKYENLDKGISIKYPSDWNITSDWYNLVLSPTTTVYTGAVEELNKTSSPVEFETTADDTSLTISTENRNIYNANSSLSEIINDKITQYADDEIGLHNFTKFGSNFTNWLTEHNQPAFMLNYSYVGSYLGNDTIINNTEIITTYDDKVYSILFSMGESPEYQQYLADVKQMMNSLKIFSMMPYANFDIGMSIKYPSYWNKTEEDSPSVLFNPPPQGDMMQPSNELRISSYLSDKSLDEEVKQTIADYARDYLGYQDFVLISNNSVYLKNSYGPAYMLNYTYKDLYSDKNISASEIITSLTNKIYSIKYSAVTDEFSEDLPILNSLNDTFENFDVTRYEFPVANQSGMIVRYPNVDLYPWDLKEIDDNNIDLLRENPLVPSILRHLLVSAYPYNGSLTELENDLGEFYDKYGYHILNENKSDTFRTPFDENVTAHRAEFSYYDKNADEDVRGVQVFTVYNNYAFIITFFAEPFGYKEYLSKVEEVIDSLKIITPINDTEEYFVPKHLQGGLVSDISYPKSWNFTSVGVGFNKFVSPFENNITDHFNETMFMIASAAGSTNLEDSVGQYVNTLKQQNLTNFALGESESYQSDFLNNSAHYLTYSYRNDKYEDLYQTACQCDIQEAVISTIADKKLYTFRFVAEQDKFRSYLPIFDRIVDSIKIREKGSLNIKDKSGLPLNGRPVDLAINPATNKLYVANPEARQVQVIDALTDRVIQNISIGAYPNALALNQFTNRIYAASPETDMIYVIDGITNNITSKIQAGPLVGDVAIDTNEFGGFGSLVFVSNAGGLQTPQGMMGSVSIIDDTSGQVEANVVTQPNPFGIAIDTIRNRAYVTTDSGVDVIDYSTSSAGRQVSAHNLETMPVGNIPTGIVVDSNTSKAYMTNSAIDTVSVIDTASNRELKQIKVGLFPWSLAFDPGEKILYVANSGNNIVSIINTTSDLNIDSIPIDSIPSDVAINPNTKIVYLSNPESRTISTIDANANTSKPVSAVIFHIQPQNAGQIECDENGYWKKFPENKYQRIIVDSKCRAVPNSGYKFSSWSEGEPNSNLTGIPGNLTWYTAAPFIIGNLLDISTSTPGKNFTVTKYGTHAANFISSTAILQALSPVISIGCLLLVILLAAVAPTLRIRRKRKEGKDEKREKNIQAIAIWSGEVGEIKGSENNKSVEEFAHLERGEILTIDATVLIGVLLFLTLTDGFEAAEQYQINIITASIVFPFAISAIIGITKHRGFATRLMIAGFINLMISVILIAGMKLS